MRLPSAARRCTEIWKHLEGHRESRERSDSLLYRRSFSHTLYAVSWTEMERLRGIGDRPVLQIYSGLQVFLTDMAVAIERATGMYVPNVNANRTLWYIKWSSVRARSLASWLYFENPGIALDRKLAIATKFLGWPHNRRLKGE